MRTIAVIFVAAAALAACGPRPTPQTHASNQAHLTAQQYEAQASADEAEANRLEAQAGQTGAAPAQSADASATGTQTLGPGDQTLQSGEYFKAIPIQMNAGDVYQVNYTAHGYAPAILVLDQNKQPFTRSVSGPNLQPGEPLTAEVRPDQAGTWYVLLTAQSVGAGGTFEVNVQKVTETPLG
ncbi:MAG TPA: hypothetical protein VGL58_16535 [Caulobacteraceae bacterium]|jgi:hypothetical protein